ncbi:ATP-binding cassette domain-containing protein [Metallosphaera hakonensis]|uniref:Peptide ABC transporter ATP-binding protein n=1 Tax=Metallosphaera hakonensis JCM 8857 = DSM 7519 TaxID=1293036 RepID=A0A2U9IVY7_9CREN|nr:ATP-binding cassette domain-containing protein [Metallosphaera hakonensis]AWS00220.1 ATP-binding cassette domain-containing protein [Metallosphaera hakonensis JCM 8857 = DSM 7519]
MLEYRCLTVGESLKCFNVTLGKESIGVLGEKDSGKEVIIPATLGLLSNVSGSILLDGTDLVKSKDILLKARWEKISAVFYDPASMFNPIYDIGSHFAEIVVSHEMGNPEYGIETGIEFLKVLGVEKEVMEKLPHQLSPVQLKKVAIALATFLEPDHVIIDDLEFGLGDIGRAAVVNSLIDLMGSVRSSFMILENNPGILSRLSDRIVVLYSGEMVEEGKDVLITPLHPYTVDLIAGEIKDKKRKAKGCPYSGECRHATPKCLGEIPWLTLGNQRVRCVAYTTGA